MIRMFLSFSQNRSKDVPQIFIHSLENDRNWNSTIFFDKLGLRNGRTVHTFNCLYAWFFRLLLHRFFFLYNLLQRLLYFLIILFLLSFLHLLRKREYLTQSILNFGLTFVDSLLTPFNIFLLNLTK